MARHHRLGIRQLLHRKATHMKRARRFNSQISTAKRHMKHEIHEVHRIASVIEHKRAKRTRVRASR